MPNQSSIDKHAVLGRLPGEQASQLLQSDLGPRLHDSEMLAATWQLTCFQVLVKWICCVHRSSFEESRSSHDALLLQTQ